MLTKSKEQVAWLAGEAARRTIQQHVSVGYNISSNTIMGQLTDLIAKAIEAGIAEALNNMYTNEEFEQDIGINS